MLGCVRCGKEGHIAILCTSFTKERGSQEVLDQDATFASGVFIGTADGMVYYQAGKRVATAGDGLCLYSSISHSIPDTTSYGLRDKRYSQ